MNLRLTLHVLGGLLLFLGVMLLAPIGFSLYYGDGQLFSFLLSAAVTSATGGILYRGFRRRDGSRGAFSRHGASPVRGVLL